MGWKMKVGFIGLGKLGLPCAVVAAKHHDVMGNDLDPSRMSLSPQPYQEAGPDGTGNFNDFLADSSIKFGTMQEVCDHSEMIFIAIQTPHHPQYEGTMVLPHGRKDFDYTFLTDVMKDLAECITRKTYVVIISTVLPGTIRRDVLPLCTEHMRVCYNPYFIAMGTTMRDFIEPEFILFGEHHDDALEKAKEFYSAFTTCPIYDTNIENAELLKVAYNLFIGQKIIMANTIMEICDKTPGCDSDVITEGFALGTTRLISPAYLKGGMGDGGGCHPRDMVAMSWYGEQIDLSYNLFEHMIRAREMHSSYLAKKCLEEAGEHRAIILMGLSFKKHCNLTVGSPAYLLAYQLMTDFKWAGRAQIRDVWGWDPYINPDEISQFIINDEQLPETKKWSDCTMPETVTFGVEMPVFILTCNHDDWQTFPFPEGSVVIDPWRMVDPSLFTNKVKYVPIGRSE